MSAFINKIAQLINGKKEQKILMIGLENSGKTTILYQYKINEFVTTIPTSGYNVEVVEDQDFKYTIWDIGAQFDKLWHNYLTETDALIYVLDSEDEGVLNEAKSDLEEAINRPELKGIPILVLANKQDRETSMKAVQINQFLNLNSINGISEWNIQGCCAIDGEGLNEGLKWISLMLSQKLPKQ